MSELHVRRIRVAFENAYKGLIDLSNVKTRQEESLESAFLTRSQAAAVLAHSADIDKATAASSVTDDYNDNGIDALYVDPESHIVYIVQSKWVASGNRSIDVGDTHKFVSGFKDLINARFDRFGPKVQSKESELIQALDDADAKFLLLLAYTSTQPLSDPVRELLNKLLEEENDPTDFVSLKVYSQKELMNMVAGQLEGEPINLEVALHEWGQIREPYSAFYGQVAAEEIARWYKDHGTRLFARNLRKFKGDTEVNQAIKSTLVRESGKFWYFNNGITVLCNSIKKKPQGGSERSVGWFECKGASVVNGAQTVGTIATTYSQGFQNIEQARVLVRFISLENCPSGFAAEVTTATNTQNRIERRDFASLDPTQERLRNELWLDENKLYAYKSGENPSLAEGCTIDEATVALACAHQDLQLAVDAKNVISRLWEDIQRPPYTLLFNPDLSARRLWRSVEIARVVEAKLEEEKIRRKGPERMIAVHGNRFILHRVFRAIPSNRFDDPKLDFQEVKTQAREKTVQVLDEITRAVNERFPHAYLNSFFKSKAKCSELALHLPRDSSPARQTLTSPDITQMEMFGNDEMPFSG